MKSTKIWTTKFGLVDKESYRARTNIVALISNLTDFATDNDLREIVYHLKNFVPDGEFEHLLQKHNLSDDLKRKL